MKQLEQGVSGVMLLLVVGSEVSVPVGGGHSRASCWQRFVREMSLIVGRWGLLTKL